MDPLVNDLDYEDVPEVSSYEDYEHLKAKQKASVLWLLSKAYNNDIASDLRDPFYKDHDEQDRLKPQIIQSLANAELYCLALANIYSDPNYHCLNHHGIMQILMRKGVYMVEPHDASLTETVLIQNAPIKMSAHMVIIEGIMTLYIKEVLIPDKVADVVSRFSSLEADEIPEYPEDAALFWINKSCVQLKQVMQKELNEDESTRTEPTPSLPMLEDITDMSDGCCLAALLSVYCPDHLRWQEICLNKEMSMADSIYNLQLVQFFCQEKLPYNICFLSLEDFLYLHETIQPNVLAFIADLLFLFEIRPAKCVRQPGVDYDEAIGDENENLQNGNALCYPELPTPSEMKLKSLQHSSWVDERQHNNVSTPQRPPRRTSAKSGQRRLSSHNLSDEDEELTRYFSALDIKPDIESSPEILMIAERNVHKSSVKSGPKSITSYHNNRDYIKDNTEQNEFNLSSSPVRHSEILNGNSNNKSSSQLADYFSQLAQTNSSPSKKSLPNTTSFAKLNLENTKNSSAADLSPEPAINIAYLNKNDKSSGNEQRSPVKSVSTRYIPHINKTDSVKQLLEDNDNNESTNNISNYNEKNISTDSQKSVDSEIASQVYNIRMKLEEKRRKIEMERKSAEEEWKSKRQDIGKEAFLRVVHKNGLDEVECDGTDVRISKFDNLSQSKPSNSYNKKENVSLNDLEQDLDSVKRKWLGEKNLSENQKPFVLNQSGERSNFDELRASIDLMESSITDIDADLERLEEHEKMLRSQQIQNAVNSKFYLHSDQRIPPQPPIQASQPFHLSAEPHTQIQSQQQQNFHSLSIQQQNIQPIHPSMLQPSVQSSPQQQIQQQRAIWSDSQAFNPNEMAQQMGPRRGHWGQPVMPVSTNTGTGINQWKAVPVQQQIDPNFHQTGYEAYDIQGQRPNPTIPYSQTFNPMTSQNNFNYPIGGHFNSLNPQQSPYVHQNGPIPQNQYNLQQTYPQPQYGQNSSAGPYLPTQQFNPNISYNQIPSQMMANADQNYHSMSINHFNNQQINQENGPQMIPLVSQTPTLMNSQPTNLPAVSIPAQYESYDTQQVFSSPTNKPFHGRTFRVMKSKVLSPDISEHDSPTRSIISEFSNEVLNNGKSDNSQNSSAKEHSDDRDANYSKESFFVSFGNDSKSKAKPGLKPKQVKLQQQMRREMKAANNSSATGFDITAQDSDSQNGSTCDTDTPNKQIRSQSPKGSPGVGFVIGADLVNLDPNSEQEMAKKKESIMLQSLKRRAEQETKRLKKEQELAHKKEDERLRRELSERKKEEERVKRDFILEQYRQRKAAEDAEKNGPVYSGNASTISSRDSVKSNSTLVLNRPSRQRLFQTGKPRPKSLHISASNIQDYSSLDCKPSRIMDDTDSCQMLSSNSNSRPQSAMSTQSINSGFSLSTARRLPSPTQSHASHVPSYSTGFMLSRVRGPPSDGASDAGSTFSEYTGPKLFVKPSQKSNKTLILNAINAVLAGAVNNETKKKVLEEINASDSKHYLILFRNAGLQFRGIYSYNPDRDEVLKLYGTGPKSVCNEMIDRFYKYNSGSKSFAEIQTKHLSVTIDAFIIHNNLWTGKRVIPKKDYL